jgi:spore coat protein U-like protein
MPHPFKPLALAVLCAGLFAGGSTAPAGAQIGPPPAGAQAVLTVSAAVTSDCEVLGNPPALLMAYNPVLDEAKQGTSSFQYTCTNGTSVSVTPTSINCASSSSSSSSCTGTNWEATTGLAQVQQGTSPLLYSLWNGTTCSLGSSSSSGSQQLSNGVQELLLDGTGLPQTYNICAIPNTGQETLTAGKYQDTVTFTFNMFNPKL